MQFSPTSVPDAPPGTPLQRRLFLLACGLLFLAFAVYGSFVPFRFTRVTLDEALARFPPFQFDLRRGSGTDFVANVLLFVPIGIALAGAIADRSRALALLSAPIVAALAFAASLAIEFGQIFMAGRTPSWYDVVGETTGAALGALAWAAAGPRVIVWLRPLVAPAGAVQRARRLLGVYVAVWAMLHVLPFDFTLRPAELAEKYRAGRIVARPFADTPTLLDALLTLGGGAIQAVPVGALAAISVSSGSRLASASLLGLAAILTLEFAQLLVFSRTADTTDLLAGAIGALAGVWLGTRWIQNVEAARPAAPSERSAGVRAWAGVALLVWVIVLVIRHWAPFDFVLTRQMFEARVPQLYEVPFHHHYWSDYLHALDEAVETILLGVPVGLLLQILWPAPRGRMPRLAQRSLFIACAGLLLAGIELGQVFVPSRVPDNTDILLGLAGTAIGIAAVRLVRRT